MLWRNMSIVMAGRGGKVWPHWRHQNVALVCPGVFARTFGTDKFDKIIINNNKKKSFFHCLFFIVTIRFLVLKKNLFFIVTIRFLVLKKNLFFIVTIRFLVLEKKFWCLLIVHCALFFGSIVLLLFIIPASSLHSADPSCFRLSDVTVVRGIR